MNEPSYYRNYSPGARSLARVLDLLAAPLAGLPASSARRPAVPQQTMGSKAAGGSPSKILLIRPDHAGDLLMATPAIRALRRAHPRARIEVLVSPWGAPALAGNPDVDAVRAIEATWFEPGRREGPEPRLLIAALVSLRLARYAAAADLRGDFRSILIARASGAPRRAGFSRLGLEALLTDWVPFDPSLDHVSRNHAVVSLLGAGRIERRRPIFVIPEEARAAARGLLALLPPDRPVLAVFPGTNRPSATWGARRFEEACRLLWLRRPVSIVIGGREADRPAAAAVAEAARSYGKGVLDLTGRTGFAEAAAVIERASALLANDSGAAHLGVAVGTPVAAIFGPTDPSTLWTWDPPDRYVALAGPSSCPRPCFDGACGGDHGYSAIQPQDVAALLERLIEMPREAPLR